MRIGLSNVGHAYHPGDWLFRGLTAEFLAGHSYAITGASGSGKSTLLAMLSGWITPTEGKVLDGSVERRSWVFQNPHGVPHRTAIDHVAYPYLTRGVPLPQALQYASDMLARFSLAPIADREFQHLSGGEAQRLMLARATAIEPQLLLVDEPTAQLDRSTASSVNRVLSNAVNDQMILLVATHDPETRDACDYEIDLTAYRFEVQGGLK